MYLRQPVCTLLLLATSALAADLSFSGTGLKAPVFDPSGHLIRRLTAASAAGSLATPALSNGQVEFFAQDSTEEPMAILTFDHAVYNKAAESLTGRDTLKLVAPARHETLTGQGFTGQLATGRLTLHSDVTWESLSARLHGDQAEIRFDPKAAKKEDAIQEVILTGQVTLDRLSTATSSFDRAETTQARYDAGQQKIFLRNPVTTWTKGDKTVGEFGTGYMEIILPPPVKAASEPAARPTTSLPAPTLK